MPIFAIIGAILALLWLLGMKTLGPLDTGGLMWLTLFMHLIFGGIALPTLVRRRQ